MGKKMEAQAAAEFLVIFMIFMAALTLASFYALQRTQSVVTYRIELEATKALEDVRNKIDTAFLEGDGFMINASLPENILGQNYTMSIMQNTLILTTDGITYSRTLLTKNVTGSISKGRNLIRNINGAISIS